MKKQLITKEVLLAILIFFIAGYQNAYTYMDRGKIFANLQTGNMVLMSIHLANHEYQQALIYITPLAFFSLGCAIAAFLQLKFSYTYKKYNWQSLIIILEIIFCIVACLIPHEYDVLASSIISLNSALSLVAFSTIGNYCMPPTMMIGNLKNSITSFTEYILTKDKTSLLFGARTLFYVIVFLFGAVISAYLVTIFDTLTIILLIIPYIACLFLLRQTI